MAESPYSDEEKLEVLAIYSAQGLAEAHRLTGHPKSTIKKWADDFGIEVENVNQAVLEQTKNATEASRASRALKLQKSKDRITLALTTIAELGAKAEIEILQDGNRDARLHEIVGARTRAIHDLRLMSDEATENVAVAMSISPAQALRNKLDAMAEREHSAAETLDAEIVELPTAEGQ